MEAAGGGEDEGARGVEAGAAKPRWHGAGAGMANVNGGGARRDDGALGGDVDGGGARGARAVGGAGERTAGGRKGEGGRKEI